MQRKISPYLLLPSMNPRQISIDSYSYDLPAERIAQFPLERRDDSLMLICRDESVSHDRFFNLPAHLPAGSLVVFNETKVVHARLIFHKETGTAIEVFCLEPLVPEKDFQAAFQQRGQAEWKCLVGNSKRWKSGAIELRGPLLGDEFVIRAVRMEKGNDGTSRIRFEWQPGHHAFAEVLEIAGKLPLPPYITREPLARDDITYQTIYARQEGSVAAPTAGLHFTDQVMAGLQKKGISTLNFTLHVGAGTFKPVTASELGDHEMHAEPVFFTLQDLKTFRNSLDKPIVLVGTTSARMTESLYWHGVKIITKKTGELHMDVGQWEPYDLGPASAISREEALEAVIRHCEKHGLQSLQGHTRLIIVPGYRFRFPDMLITNFHQPKSTLLLLIAAFAGENWQKAYRYALDHGFRFLSYGDSCLFFKSTALP